MDGLTGEWYLKKIVIRYSETGGSSLFVRFYLKHLLREWRDRNPQVEVITEHSIYEHPKVTAFYKTGEQAEASLRNLSAQQVEDMLNLYRDSHGPNLYLRHGGPKCWTERRSIQGLWQPSLDLAIKQIKALHRSADNTSASGRPKYSETSLKLAQQHYNGVGRWGDEREGIKGFDQHRLRDMFSNPFLPNSQLCVQMMRRIAK